MSNFQVAYIPVGVPTFHMESAAVNKANVLTLGGWVTAPEKAVEMIKIWIDTPFGEGFPSDRVEFLENAFLNVQAMEDENMK